VEWLAACSSPGLQERKFRCELQLDKVVQGAGEGRTAEQPEEASHGQRRVAKGSMTMAGPWVTVMLGWQQRAYGASGTENRLSFKDWIGN
jgi:hypothetical protein